MKFVKQNLIPCPILTPTEQEFYDPISYLSSPHVRKLGNEYGLLKVVPPPNFKPGFQLSRTFRFHTRLQKLSDLGLNTRSRRFFTDSLNRFLKMRKKRQVRHFFNVYIADTGQRMPTRSHPTTSTKVSPEEPSIRPRTPSQSDLTKNCPNRSKIAPTTPQTTTTINTDPQTPTEPTGFNDTNPGSSLKVEIIHSSTADNPNLPPSEGPVKLEQPQGSKNDHSGLRSVIKRVFYYDVYVAVEKLGGITEMNGEKWQNINCQFGIPIHSQEIKNQYELNVANYSIYVSSHQNEEFPDSDSEDEFASCLICGNHNKPSETLLCDNCDNPYHMSCLSPPISEVPQGSWYCPKCLVGTGDYGFEEDVDKKYTLEEFWSKCEQFDQRFIQEYNNGKPLTVDVIEKKFWEFVDAQKSDLVVHYGADIHNLIPGEISGFPMVDSPGLNSNDPLVKYYINHPFNLTKLPFSRGSLLNYINHTISGMTVPWIYIGSLLATFCWHVEDHYTLSANYCHFGATKKWYGIPSFDADKFEQLMRDSAPDLFQKQPDLLHQLVTLMNPMQLVENGIRCVYADQNPGEYIITYPRVYHAGFNCGFNFNEAVNFTMNNWLEFGEMAVEDYKKTKKENVFNHYQLVENVLRNFNLHPKHNLPKDYIDLVTRCCKSFEAFNERQRQLLSNDNLARFERVHKPRKLVNQLYEFDDTEDEKLCDLCKTHTSYQYCIMKNTRGNRLKLKSATRCGKSQLLTPEASPQELITTKQKDSVQVPQQDNLQTLHASCVMDEYDQLINEAKRAAKDDASTGSRRKSRRIEKIQEKEIATTDNNSTTTRMGKKKSRNAHTITQLESKPIVNLCLECTISIGEKYTIPSGLTLVYEDEPDVFQALIEETKRNLEKCVV